jgi:hypothetical protein
MLLLVSMVSALSSHDATPNATANSLPASAFEQYRAEFRAARGDKNDVESAALAESLFAEYFGNSPRANLLGNDQLSTLFAALNHRHAYVESPRSLAALTEVFQILQQRTLDSAEVVENYFVALVAMRELARAQALHPKLSSQWGAFPAFELAADANATPLLWRIDKNSLLQQQAKLADRQIIVITHPNCRYSIASMQAIAGAPAISKLLAEHAMFITPVDGYITRQFERYVEWNQQYPAHSLRITHSTKQWPMIKSWSTPTFLFLKNGEIEATVSGWSNKEQLEKIQAAWLSIAE